MSIFEMLLANAMGESGGGGGGGSSDFSTAEVTITNTAEDTTIQLMGTCIDEDGLVIDGFAYYGETTITIVLYKGSQSVNISMAELTSTNGNITGNLADGFTITGDCSIVGKGYGYN